MSLDSYLWHCPSTVSSDQSVNIIDNSTDLNKPIHKVQYIISAKLPKYQVNSCGYMHAMQTKLF